MTASDDGAKLRKERVHNTMLIELLVSLVFLAMAFAYVQNEDLSVSTLTSKIKALEDELSSARAQIAKLEKERRVLLDSNERLREQLARWMKVPRSTLSPNDEIVALPLRDLTVLKDQLSNANALVVALQKENAELRAKLLGPKSGTGLPNCVVTAGFLLNVEMLESGGFRATPSWTAGAESVARTISGLSELSNGSQYSSAQWSGLARNVAAWGLARTIPCRFRVSAMESHGDLNLYKRQLQLIEQYFYVRRGR